MPLEKVNRSFWEKRIVDSIYCTAFHEINVITLFTKAIGGEFELFYAKEQNKEWLISIFYGSPWTENSNEFATSCVGYGGPLPLHKVEDVVSEISDLKDIILQIENLTGKKFHHGQLYPANHWSNLNLTNTLNETLLVDLKESLDETFKSVLTVNARNAVRKARKKEIKVREPINNEELVIAHDLIVKTQIRVGASYTTPFSLIEAIYKSKDFPAKIFIAVFKDKIIGSVLLLENKVQSFHWLHGWDRSYADLCGNQLLIWTMIISCVSNGCLKLNLGMNHTIAQKKAKMQWGAIPINILTISKTDLD